MVRRKIGTTTYTLDYDHENQLTSVSSVGLTASFVYDGDGNRVQGTVNGVTTTYIGNYLEWTGSTSTMKRYYYAGTARVAMREGSTLRWILGDHLGSTNRLANSDGSPYRMVLYKGSGETRYTDGSLPTTYKFTGQRQESSFGGTEGLYYYGARWYDPYLNRWIQPDSIVPGLNGSNVPTNPQAWDRYAYANNSPVVYNDPSGHDPKGPGYCYEPDDPACNTEPAPPIDPAKDISQDVVIDASTLSLFRAVSDGELSDILNTNIFRPDPSGASMDAKWFWLEPGSAEDFMSNYSELTTIVEA